MKRLLVLGSTGSIGESSLAVARDLRDEMRVVGIACAHDAARLAIQAAEHGVEAVACAGGCTAATFPPGVRVHEGADAVSALVEEARADIVVNGIGGAAGLLPSFSALRAGADLALANKESLVMAGSLLLAEAARRGRRILPVDSEHAALWSLLAHRRPEDVIDLLITASGGAYRDVPDGELPRMKAADALKHPTWRMGKKITVDSATLANKGLEVIEAHRLFGIALDHIRILIHPESFVHGLVRTIDGTLHAELSTPDMRIPIQNALTAPELRPSAVPWLELAGRSLGFQPVRPERSPMLGLAYAAARRSPAHPIVYNAANEVAVGLFLSDAIPLAGIAAMTEDALALSWTESCDTLEEILAVDAAARRRAREHMKGYTL
jgi:1-deoxy-D-xylulose-5-phosphate reductoisomerase